MVARRDRAHWSIVAAAVAGLALVIGMAWVVLGWVWGSSAVADPRASALGFLLASAVSGVGLVGWVRRRRAAAAAPVTAEQVGKAVATLAEVVAEQWVQEARMRSLEDPEPMPVRWRLLEHVSGTAVMDHPEVIAPAGLTFTGSSERIAEVAAAFRRLDRRRLVIIGGAGTGKTTLALQLLLELLAHPQPGEPVPVLFSVVSWDPHEQPRLQDWLSARLERDYPGLRVFGTGIAQALVERGKILPILDGLDEVPATLRPGIITALNDALLPAHSGLILTSRRAEYAAAVAGAGDVLTAAAVIAPLALTRLEAASYLRKLLPPEPGAAWSRVLGQLETGTAAELATVTASPLGLWLVRTVYLDGQRDPTPLVQDTYPDRSTQPTLRTQLLDQLIPAVLHNRAPTPVRRSSDARAPLRPRRQHDPDDARRWLTTLAEELRAAGTRDWLWWHLARHTFPTTRTTLTAKLAVGLVVGLVLGLPVMLVGVLGARAGGWSIRGVFMLAGVLAVGLTAASKKRPSLGLRVQISDLWQFLAFGVVIGQPFVLIDVLLLPVELVVVLVGVLPIGLAFGLTAAPKHADLRLRGRVSELWRRVKGKLVVGLMLGWMLRVMMDPAENAPTTDWAAVIWSAAGSVVGLAFGLIDFGANPSSVRRASTPAESQREDRQLTILVISTTGLALGLALGLATGLLYGLSAGLVFGLLFGLVVGLVVGLVDRAWPAFLVASGWLVLRQRFPCRLMAFLEDAYRLGLLRVVGSAYQFRHAELQDHLAH
jgi:hypothetical protein